MGLLPFFFCGSAENRVENSVESQVLKINDARTKVPQSGPRTPGQAAPSAGPHPRPHRPPQWRGRGVQPTTAAAGGLWSRDSSPASLSYPDHPFFTSYRGEGTREFISKRCGQLAPSERAKRKENCPERSDVDSDTQRPESRSEGESSPPRRRPQGEGESTRILPGPLEARAPGRTQSSWRFTQRPQTLPKLEPIGRARVRHR